jgi:hypothetical protein
MLLLLLLLPVYFRSFGGKHDYQACNFDSMTLCYVPRKRNISKHGNNVDYINVASRAGRSGF